MNDAQADMDAATAIATRMSQELVAKRHASVSKAAQEELAAVKELQTAATLMVEPLTSPMPSPVEPGFIEEYKGALMHYPSDRCIHLGQQITQILLTSSAPEAVLPKIAEVVGRSLQADACFIKAIASHQATPQAAFWYAEAFSGSNGTSNVAEVGTVEFKSVRPLSSKGWMQENAVLEEILSDRQPVAISDTQAIETGRAWEDPVRAVLGIQTQFQSSANGVIVVGRSQPGDWTEIEKELLKAVSDSVAIAISQVQLQRQVRIAAQYQILINQLTLAIRAGKDVNQILQLALAGTAQAFQVHRGFILLLKYVAPPLKNRSLKQIPKAKVTVVCEWSSQSNSEQPAIKETTASVLPSWLNHSFALSECHWCQQVFMQSPELLAIANQADLATSNPADTSASQSSDLFKEAMPALLMVPLESQGTVLGFLVLQHHQPRSWQSEELELVKLVSAQASTAIIQTQSLRQVQALVEERTAQLQGSMEVQAKLYEKTRQQLDQLRQLNQVKDEFISNLSHELNTPLTTMKLAIRMLRQAEQSPESRAKYLQMLDEQCTREIDLIADLLALQKLESKKSSIHLQKIDLKQVIQELVEPFEQKWVDKGLTLAVELPKRSLMLQTDTDSLNRILHELLTNAGKYSEPDSTVHLRAAHEINPQGNQIVLYLSNNGPGISPAEMGYIFDKFRRGKGITEQAIQGTGLGLALVKSLVQHLNGAIAVSSCSTEDTHACETCFTLTLPQSFDSTQV
ncbi:GAF domain-containing protein [Coleofasciculus sp. FACHB-129]|uniref:GAF domain-containing sensor histidine kinase n=1 Tax=Cyanophyceae TaxID=3028117 RepID=UPI001684F2C7|nr:GAF domain-containing protein [Coleofasciculus sp. FACHB-129]MBD1893776.1 GAF domain-containing protein [Coleofasciculus sp. FACHB-129]